MAVSATPADSLGYLRALEAEHEEDGMFSHSVDSWGKKWLAVEAMKGGGR